MSDTETTFVDVAKTAAEKNMEVGILPKRSKAGVGQVTVRVYYPRGVARCHQLTARRQGPPEKAAHMLKAAIGEMMTEAEDQGLTVN